MANNVGVNITVQQVIYAEKVKVSTGAARAVAGFARSNIGSTVLMSAQGSTVPKRPTEGRLYPI